MNRCVFPIVLYVSLLMVPFQPGVGAPATLPTSPGHTVSPSWSLVPKGCHINETEVTCLATKAADIPYFIDSLPRNISSISISGCDQELNIDSIKFPDLIHLHISTCEIRNISLKTFQSLNRLETFDLKNNHIHQLDGKFFVGLTSLVTIDLSNNGLSSLDKDIFQPLTNLSMLDVSNNRLTEFRSILSSKNMKQLDLSGNNGITNATVGTGTTYVCVLDLSYTGITTLHRGAFANLVCEEGGQPSKMNISFDNNHLTEIDTYTFAGMRNTSIGTLSLKETRWDFTSVHSALGDLFMSLRNRSVDFLLLSGCLLSEEYVDVFTLLNETAYLGTLDVSGNIFGPTSKSWPIYFTRLASAHTMRRLILSDNNFNKGLVFSVTMPYLEELDLSNNQIRIYRDSVRFSDDDKVTVPSLKVLNMSSALGVSFIKPNVKTNVTWFGKLKTLQELYLDDNYKLFDSSHDYHFSVILSGLKNLRKLSLADTGFGRRNFTMEELKNFFIDQRNSLVWLRLRNNYMSHKQLLILKGLQKLEVLDLSSNRIGYLDDKWFNQNLRELDVSDNSLLTISCVGTLKRGLESKLERMWIGDNSYDCTCPLADFVNWLNQHAVQKDPDNKLGTRKLHIPDLDHAQCMGPEKANGILIIEYPFSWFLCSNRGMIILGGIGGALLIVFVIAIVVIYRCRVNIHFCLMTSDRRRKHKILSQGIFMGYCDGHKGENLARNLEEQWVNDNINTNLELCNDLPLVINFMSPITTNTSLGEQILEGHEGFRFIMLIVGPLFIKHCWESIRDDVCSNREVMKKCCKKIVLVLLGRKKKDLPDDMKVLLKHGACYEWTKKRDDRFWKRLKLKLCEKRGVCCF